MTDEQAGNRQTLVPWVRKRSKWPHVLQLAQAAGLGGHQGVGVQPGNAPDIKARLPRYHYAVAGQAVRMLTPVTSSSEEKDKDPEVEVDPSMHHN